MQRTIIFGDAHGCIEPIHRLMDLIGPSSDDRIISVGDFVDRGPDSPACTAFVMRHESVMGNHEYKHVRKILSLSQQEARDQFPGAGLTYEDAVAFMASLPFSIELEEAIVVHAGIDVRSPLDQQDPLVSVGGYARRRICDVDKTKDPRRPYWANWYPDDAKPIICGHLWWAWPKPALFPTKKNLYPLDTGCVKGVQAGGKLTAISLPDFSIYQVPGRLS